MMLGDLLPDQPDRDNPGLLQAVNVYPYAGAYRPAYGFDPETNALDTRCLGAAVLQNAAGSIYNYAGDAGKVYVRSGDTYSSVDTGFSAVRWEFDSYYDTVVAVNGGDAPQQGSFGSTLAAITSGPSGASTICVARNFTIVGNDATDSARISWGPLGDATTMTGGESGSQHLDGVGNVTRLFGGEYVTVLCERGIVRMSYVGPPAQWQFDVVEDNRGLLWPGMAAKAGHMIYYLDLAGFYAFDGNRSRPISSTRLTQTFFDDFDIEAGAVCSAIADTANNLIIFAYPGEGHSPNICNKQMIYNYVEDKWSGPIERPVEVLVYSRVPASFSDDFSTPATDYCDGATYGTTTVDNETFAGGNDPRVGAFTTAHKHGRDVGPVLAALIETGEYSFTPNGYTFVLGVRPIVDGATEGIFATVDHRNTTGGSVSSGTFTAINSRTGIADYRSNARYHRFRVVTTGDYESISGIEPVLQRGGQ